MYLLPDHNAGFVSLVGLDGAELPNAVLASLSYFGLPPAEDFPQEGQALTDLSIYEGVYEDRWNLGVLQITATDTVLLVEMPLLDQMGISYNPEWRPYTKHNFTTTIDGHDLLVRFEADEEGAIQYVVHRAFVAERIE